MWQPEDVHLVRDILKLEHEPLNEVLKVDSLRPDHPDSAANPHPHHHTVVNTSFTKSGRPVNANPQIRWKSLANARLAVSVAVPANSAVDGGENGPHPLTTVPSSTNNADIAELLTDVNTGKKTVLPQFRLAGNSMGGGVGKVKNSIFDEIGRPVPTEIEIDDPVRTLFLIFLIIFKTPFIMNYKKKDKAQRSI